MAPKAKHSSPIPIGNCVITVEAKNFTCRSDSKSLQISLPNSGKINISAAEDIATSNRNEHEFVLVNPRDADGISKSYLQEVLQLYMKELPGMNYAANTGKKSKFLERCVTNGKYRTLLLKSSSVVDSGKVIAAITYQIIPADMEYAEIPLAAVTTTYQRKGLGHMSFLELRKRLESVGVRSIFCWGDRESEGFWLKEGFIPIAEVDTKGRPRRLPVKADIRKALCFPGGSTLMIFHLRKDFLADAEKSSKCLPSQQQQNSMTSGIAITENERLELSGKLQIDLDFLNRPTDRTENAENCLPEAALVKDGSSKENEKLSVGLDSHSSRHGYSDIVSLARLDGDTIAPCPELCVGGFDADMNCPHYTRGAKRAWEASLSSLKSKRVKGSQLVDCRSNSSWGFISEDDRTNTFLVEVPHGDSIVNRENKFENCKEACLPLEAPFNEELQSSKQCFRIMLMNIADDAKKTYLTKVIQDLGGTVTSDGSMATHVVTGEVRKTLNFCTALCSGASVVSSSWLKQSCREGRFVDELPYILNDKDYLLKYKSDLKSAVLRAKASPQALLKGYDVCISAHVQPPAKTLSAIVMSAGGKVVCQLEEVNETSSTIFVACEEDMEEAMMAAKKGIQTFSSEWFMNCVMRQELDLKAPQFAVSL